MSMVANLNTAVIYHGILTLENVGIAVNYYGIFITLAPGAKKYNLLVALSEGESSVQLTSSLR